MGRTVELRFTVSRIGNLKRNKNVFGLVFYDMVLTRESSEVVTDRLLITDEGVKVLDVRQ